MRGSQDRPKGDHPTSAGIIRLASGEGTSIMSPRMEAPARIAWAVDQLEVGEVDRILEIGGGRGVAAALICARLIRGSYVGIDRSATAVSASAVRNREQVERGTARFERQALEEVDPTQLPRFDKIFAINVNLFWIRPAQGELALVRQLLSDPGQLHLFYDSPTPAGTSRITDLLAENLGRAGYTFTSATATLGQSTVIGLSCRPH
jgi:SAM-dependent methyltransferase